MEEVMEARRPHTELHDILCEFINENHTAIGELKGGDIIPRKINLSKPIDEIIDVFNRLGLLLHPDCRRKR